MWHYSQYLKLCLLWNPEKVTGSTDALLLEIDYLIEKCRFSWKLEAYADLFFIQTFSLSSNSLNRKTSLFFTRQ